MSRIFKALAIVLFLATTVLAKAYFREVEGFPGLARRVWGMVIPTGFGGGTTEASAVAFGHGQFGQWASAVPRASGLGAAAGAWESAPVVAHTSQTRNFDSDGVYINQVASGSLAKTQFLCNTSDINGTMEAVGSYYRIKFRIPSDLADEPRVFVGLSTFTSSSTFLSTDEDDVGILGIMIVPSDAGIWHWVTNRTGSGGWTRSTTGIDHVGSFNLEIRILSTTSAKMVLSDATGAELASTTVSGGNLPVASSPLYPRTRLHKVTDTTARAIDTYGLWAYWGR